MTEAGQETADIQGSLLIIFGFPLLVWKLVLVRGHLEIHGELRGRYAVLCGPKPDLPV